MHSIKLKITTLLLIVLVVSCFATLGVTAFAQDISPDDPCDELFVDSVLQLTDSTDSYYQLSAQKYELYDMELVRFGWVYDFTYNGVRGYAIVANAFDGLDVMELSLDSEFPFDATFDGKLVYANFMNFLQYKDGTYYVAKSDKQLSDDEVEAIKASSYYSGGAVFTYSSEYVYYSGKSQNLKRLAALHPAVYNISNVANGCSPLAGASIIQYWDKDYENLIPNYTAYMMVSTAVAYKASDTTMDGVAQQLAVDMGTNVGKEGTTVSGFKSGIKTYCQRQGYSVSYTSCMTLGNFNYTKTKAQLDQNYPIALFMQDYTVTDLFNKDGYDFLDDMHSNGTHTMAAFGYREITYTLTDGGTRSDNYLLVSSGFDNRPRAHVNVKQTDNINDAFSVVVS